MKATISVVFPSKKKEYYFNVKDAQYLQKGFILYIPGYSSPVTITRIFDDIYSYVSYMSDCSSTPILHKGDIVISSSAKSFEIIYADWSLDCKSHKPISLTDAADLYIQGKKELATKIYPEEIISLQILKRATQEKTSMEELTLGERFTLNTLEKLTRIAKQLNGNWAKEHGNTGYFLYYDTYSRTWQAGAHTKVYYPGIVYFKCSTDAQKALRMLTPQERRALNGY